MPMFLLCITCCELVNALWLGMMGVCCVAVIVFGVAIWCGIGFAGFVVMGLFAWLFHAVC